MKKFIYTLALALILNSAFSIQNCFSQWQPDVRLTNATYGSETSYNNAWRIALNGLVIHVVWTDYRNGNISDVYYKRSTDAGVSWGADIRFTNNPLSQNSPTVAVSGSVVHVVWVDGRYNSGVICYKRSTDAGVSWEADLQLTYNSAMTVFPSLAVSGSVLHLVWTDYRNGNSEIYYKRSTDAGESWGADTRLTNYTTYSWTSSVAVSGLVVHVVWSENLFGNHEIYYKRSTDAGVSWSTDKRLTNNILSSMYPSVAISGSVVHVVWEEYRDGNYEIYYNHSTDSGINWGEDVRMTNNISSSLSPSVAVSGSVVHVVWEDDRDWNWGEIYYKRSTDSGVNWEEDTRLTNDSSLSFYPSVAISGSIVHVVWEDGRNGYEEIYYKRNPTGNVGIQNINTETPSKYSLSQNYPNPFNPTTNIKFSIVNVGDVKLVVYDIQGREVQTLVNERLQPGTYSTQWNAANYTSGVYFYKMQTESFTETKKLILLK